MGRSAADIVTLAQSAYSADPVRPGLGVCLSFLKNLDGCEASQLEVDLARGAALLDAESSKSLSNLLPTTSRRGGIQTPRDCVLYGFGRIGRLLCRPLTHGAGVPGLLLRAVVQNY